MLRRLRFPSIAILNALFVGTVMFSPPWSPAALAQDEGGTPADEGGGDMGGGDAGGGDAGGGDAGAGDAGGGGGGGGGAPLAAGDEGQVKTLFREGVRSYLTGNAHEAQLKLEAALRMNPPGDLVMALRDEAGYATLVDMLSEPDLKHTALRIMELSKGAQRRLERSPDEVQSLVDGLKADNFDDRMKALNLLVAVGDHAVPALIECIRDDKDDNLRANAIITLTKMGGDAVLPLMQACRSKTPLLRQNAALVLGNIKDQRAVPELKRMLEDPSELPEVKNIVAESIERLTGKDVGSLMAAKEYFTILSDKYALGHPSLLPRVYDDVVVWRWDAENDKMGEPKQIPGFAFNELVGAGFAQDAIALDSNYDPAWVALALSQISHGVEARIALEALDDAQKRGEITQEELDKAKADLAMANRGPLVGQLAGRHNLYRALKRALEMGKGELAVACIEALAGCADPNDLPASSMSRGDGGGSRVGYPLIEALIDDDKRVRYAAADALVRINPERLFLGAERVIQTLGDAASESSARAILIVSEDPGVRSALMTETKRMGCFPYAAASATEGVSKAKSFPAQDLIILEAKTANQVSFAIQIPGRAEPVIETLLDSLKGDVRTRGIPVVILCDAADLDATKAIFGEQVQGYLTSATDRNAMNDVMGQVLGNPEFQNRSKTRAEAVSLRAAQTLGWLDPANGIYSLRDAVPGLIAMLNDRPDSLKIAGAYALGRSGDTRGLAPLALGLSDANHSPAARKAFGQGMGEIYRITKAGVAKPEFEILKTALGDAEVDVAAGASAALGNASLTAKQAQEILEASRK